MIDFFVKKTSKPKEELKKLFDGIHTIDKYISNYTAESIFYKGINKFLREGNIKDFRILSNYISKFIYHLYGYKKTNNQLNEATLYRKMNITYNEFNIYKNSIGKVICYPSFTSTSLKTDWYPTNKDPNLILVELIIKQNKSPNIISIKNLSEFKNEEEFLCLPFTFFKITNVDANSYSIYLTALYSEKPLEEMFIEFMENETDNLDLEGLEILQLDKNDKIILNPYLKKIICSLS